MSTPKHDIPLNEHAQYLAKIKSKLDGNSTLPHSIEAGEPYYVGDVYEQFPSEVSREWELHDLKDRPYLQHIKTVSNAWPHLRYLADWMEVSTSPVKWNLIRDKEAIIRPERASRTRIAAIDFDAASPVSIDLINDPGHLSQSLQGLAARQAGGISRLYVVEDLSRDVIEALGLELDIDPLFFREQISDYLWYNTRDPWVELPDLHTVSRSRNYFHIRYVQPRYFRSIQSFREGVRQCGLFNVLRRIDNDKNHKTTLDAEGAVFGLVRSKLSFWSRKGIGNAGSIGILLVDPTITEGFPLWSGYRPFLNTPSMSESGPFEAAPRDSLFESIVFWSRCLAPEDIAEMRGDPRVMAYRAAQIVCAHWLTLCKYINTRLGQIEWELENPDFRKDPSGVDGPLLKLHTWRRGVPVHKTMIADAFERLFRDTALGGGASAACIADLEADYAVVEKNFDRVQHQIEQIVQVATAVISIEESRRAYSQNRYLGRLTYLAIIFAPLSFVSSLFSMSDDLSSLSTTFWMYFAIAVPFTLALFVFVDTPRIRTWTKELKNWWWKVPWPWKTKTA